MFEFHVINLILKLKFNVVNIKVDRRDIILNYTNILLFDISHRSLNNYITLFLVDAVVFAIYENLIDR